MNTYTDLFIFMTGVCAGALGMGITMIMVQWSTDQAKKGE